MDPDKATFIQALTELREEVYDDRLRFLHIIKEMTICLKEIQSQVDMAMWVIEGQAIECEFNKAVSDFFLNNIGDGSYNENDIKALRERIEVLNGRMSQFLSDGPPGSSGKDTEGEDSWTGVGIS
jgi:hypothetical protein